MIANSNTLFKVSGNIRSQYDIFHIEKKEDLNIENINKFFL